jgi:hypothetical protein
LKEILKLGFLQFDEVGSFCFFTSGFIVDLAIVEGGDVGEMNLSGSANLPVEGSSYSLNSCYFFSGVLAPLLLNMDV